MAFYEKTFVGKQDLSDKEVDALVDKYSSLIKKTGKILKTEKWGLLNLAKKIRKNKKGIYIHFKFEGQKTTVSEVEQKISVDNDIIRYLTVRYSELDLKNEYFSKRK